MGVDPILGTTIDNRFHVIEKVAANRYRGVQLSVSRPVAIEIAGGVGDRAAVRRFLHDARQLASLEHPNIASVIEFGQTAGGLYVVTERLRGKTLDDELARTGPFTARRACEVLRQVLSALAAAHARGLAHGDLRPDNIVLLELPGVGEVVKLRGFALASEGEAKPATDIYDAGRILFQLVTQEAVQLHPLIDAMLATTPERRPMAEHARGWLCALLETSAAYEEPDEAATVFMARQPAASSSVGLPTSAQPVFLPRLATATRAFTLLSMLPIVLAVALLAGTWWLYTHHGHRPTAAAVMGR